MAGKSGLCTVVLALSEGDREANLPNRDRGAVGDSGERLGWLKLIVGHLEIVECLDGQDVEPCTAIDEGPVGERSNFKKIPTHTQDHGDDIAMRGESVCPCTIVDRKRKR